MLSVKDIQNLSSTEKDELLCIMVQEIAEIKRQIHR
jgi:hypothetical protein